MSSHISDGGDSVWTTENIQRLLAELKRSVPEGYRTCSYIGGMKSVQWENVAFPPFSAEACQAKWVEILQKIRKIRSLTELITEAEERFSNPINQVEYMKDKPPLQDCNTKTQVCRDQHQDSGRRKRIRTNEFCVYSAKNEQTSKPLLPAKPPSTGYNLFCKEQRPHINRVSKSPVNIVLAQRWGALTLNEKREYCDRCKEMKRQYDFDIRALTNRSKSEELLPVKPPNTGYNLFCKEQVNHIKGVSKKMYCTVLAKRWKELTENQRGEYCVRCRELKRQYQRDLNCCLMMEDLEEENQRLDQHATRKIHNGRAAIAGEPQMPSKHSYHIFIKEEMKRLKKNIPDTKVRFAKINQKWKQLSFMQKEEYRRKLEETIAKYSLELQQWFQGLKPQEQKEYLRQNPSKCQYLNYIPTAAHKESPPMPSDSEDEDITDDSSSEDLYFDSVESDEEDEEDMDMPFMF